MIIYAICGLPGSGKTHLMNEMSKNIDCTVIDDIDSRVRLIDAMNKGGRIIITDPYLVDERSRKSLENLCEQFGCKDIRYIFFENDVDKCYANVVKRNDGRIISRYFLERLSEIYTIPEGYEVRKIKEWQK